MKLLIGKIKDDCSKDWQSLKGISLIVYRFKENDKALYVVSPIKTKEMEKFYKASYEEGLNEIISRDYSYYIWYMLNGDCELSCRINVDDLENIREMTKEDDEEYGKNLEEFKKSQGFYRTHKQIADDEKAEEKANEEFQKKKKHKIEVWTSDGLKAIVAVTYKGFGIHNPLGTEDSFFKTITILEGDNKGLAMIHYCKTSRCKTLIDEMREAIGDKDITNDDRDKLDEIVKKYRS